ncbi:MAG: hypothetical protein ABSA01_01305 [Anaerolineales bacterium]|jgi:hypothetical protein
MNKTLAYNIIQSNDLWMGGIIFKRLFGHTLGFTHLESIPPAIQRANLKIASVHNGEAASILENFANNALSCKGSCEALFFLKSEHTRQVLAGIPHIQYA